MAIPFFSIDLNLKDILNLIKNITIPSNKKNSELNIQNVLEKRFPKKKCYSSSICATWFLFNTKKIL